MHISSMGDRNYKECQVINRMTFCGIINMVYEEAICSWTSCSNWFLMALCQPALCNGQVSMELIHKYSPILNIARSLQYFKSQLLLSNTPFNYCSAATRCIFIFPHYLSLDYVFSYNSPSKVVLWLSSISSNMDLV